MGEPLDARGFRDWSKALLEREFGCPVETAGSGSGHDLVVRRPDGAIAVECKHSATSSVGRAAVQKLHSAMMTSGASRGIILSAGRFSEDAREHALVVGMPLELWDGATLATLAQRHGLESRGDISAAFAMPTTPDAEFGPRFWKAVADSRFWPMRGESPRVDVKRTTRYQPYYIGDFSADGRAATAVGPQHAAWNGTCWVDAESGHPGHGALPGWPESSLTLRALGEVVAHTRGPFEPPKVHLAEATSLLRDHLAGNLVRTVHYTGNNNVSYSKGIRPKKTSIEVSSLRLAYLPRQTFEIGGLRQPFKGSFVETPGSFQVTCEALATCGVCAGRTSVAEQVICGDCHRPAHLATWSHPHSATCSQCRATLCRTCARKAKRRVYCSACAPQAAKILGSPLRLPAMVGAGLTAGLLGLEYAMSGTLSGVSLVLSAVAWVPFMLRARSKSAPAGPLAYPKGSQAPPDGP